MHPTWQIMPDPLTVDLQSDISDTAETGRAINPGVFGRGVLRPMRRDQSGDFENAAGARIVRAAVGLVLCTICSSDTTGGELPWRTEFGSLLPLLRLRNMDAGLLTAARHYVADAIRRWVPGVRIRSCTVATGRRDTLLLRITYDVLDSSGTRVLVPGLETAIPIG